MHSVDPFDVADHVVVEHSLDVPAFRFGDLSHVLATEKPLFLPGQTGKDDAGSESVLAEDPCRFDGSGHAAGVVVRARCVGRDVEPVGSTRIDVPRHDHVAVGVGRAAKNGDDIDHFGVLRQTAVRGGDDGALGRDLETSSASFRDAVELGFDPPPSRADAAGVGLGLRHGIASAKAGEGSYVGFDSIR